MGSVIVDQAVYRDGTRRVCGDLPAELAALAGDGAGFLWIGLKDPTAEEFALVQGELGLHPLAVEDALTGDQRSKIERYDESLFVSLRTLDYVEETSQVETGEVMLFVGERFVLTVRFGESSPLSQVRRGLEGHPELLAHGPTAVLHTVMDRVVDDYVRVDAELAHDLEQIETAVFSDDRHTDTSQIYLLKREVLETRRAALPLAAPLSRLMSSDLVPDPVRPFFRDILDHLQQVIDHVDAYDRLLTDVLSAHLAQVSVRQNEDMRKISAWVAIAALPTMIAGVYGMNFERIPELTASVRLGGREVYYGYYVVLAVMVTGCALLYRGFRRNGWL